MRLAAAALLSLLIAVVPADAVERHYAPAENLERLDVQQLDAAHKTIDMAAHVLTDWPSLGTLTLYRGVMVRLYLHGAQAGSEAMEPTGPFAKLPSAPNVTVKQKRTSKPIMQCKSYCIDGRMFRTGSANLSAAGLKQQDNDLLLFDDRRMCSDFTINFDGLWTGKDAA